MSVSMLSPDEEVDVEVTWEDQQSINNFRNLNDALDDLEESYNSKKQEIDYLEDLESEIELADEDEKLYYKIGDAFIILSVSDCQDRLNADKEEFQRELEGIKNKISDTTEKMDGLKKKLYGKFGKSINLEK